MEHPQHNASTGENKICSNMRAAILSDDIVIHGCFQQYLHPFLKIPQILNKEACREAVKLIVQHGQDSQGSVAVSPTQP